MIQALKSCRFGGRNYSAGDIVPDNVIDRRALGALKLMGLIAVIPAEVKSPVETKASKGRKRNDDVQLQPDGNK